MKDAPYAYMSRNRRSKRVEVSKKTKYEKMNIEVQTPKAEDMKQTNILALHGHCLNLKT